MHETQSLTSMFTAAFSVMQQEHGQLKGLLCSRTSGEGALRSFGSSLDPPALMTSGLYGRSIRPLVLLWDNHPSHAYVAGDDRSYNKHMLLRVTLRRKILGRLCKSYPRFLFASEWSLVTALSL